MNQDLEILISFDMVLSVDPQRLLSRTIDASSPFAVSECPNSFRNVFISSKRYGLTFDQLDVYVSLKILFLLASNLGK